MRSGLSWVTFGAILLLVTLAYLKPGFMVGLSNLIFMCS